MNVRKIVSGQIDNNTFIVNNGDRCFVVDPSEGFSQIMDAINSNGLIVEAILITHADWDHIYSLNQLKAATGAKVYMHKADLGLLEKSMIRLNQEKPHIDVLLEGGEELDIIGEKVKVLHTPGHVRGCVCYIAGDDMFCGDTVFRNSIGRTDFETSDPRQMQKSIKMLSEIKEDYTLYCGHGDDSSLQYEIQNNPYFINVGLI